MTPAGLSSISIQGRLNSQLICVIIKWRCVAIAPVSPASQVHLLGGVSDRGATRHLGPVSYRDPTPTLKLQRKCGKIRREKKYPKLRESVTFARFSGSWLTRDCGRGGSRTGPRRSRQPTGERLAPSARLPIPRPSAAGRLAPASRQLPAHVTPGPYARGQQGAGRKDQVDSYPGQPTYLAPPACGVADRCPRRGRRLHRDGEARGAAQARHRQSQRQCCPAPIRGIMRMLL